VQWSKQKAVIFPALVTSKAIATFSCYRKLLTYLSWDKSQDTDIQVFKLYHRAKIFMLKLVEIYSESLRCRCVWAKVLHITLWKCESLKQRKGAAGESVVCSLKWREVVRHEVLCAMVNNCSVLDFEPVFLRIRIHHKDRVLKFFHHASYKRWKKMSKFQVPAKSCSPMLTTCKCISCIQMLPCFFVNVHFNTFGYLHFPWLPMSSAPKEHFCH
jgi:hypothetical protein